MTKELQSARDQVVGDEEFNAYIHDEEPGGFRRGAAFMKSHMSEKIAELEAQRIRIITTCMTCGDSSIPLLAVDSHYEIERLSQELVRYESMRLSYENNREATLGQWMKERDELTTLRKQVEEIISDLEEAFIAPDDHWSFIGKILKKLKGEQYAKGEK